MTSESTELTIPERASRALGLATIEADLRELAQRSQSIVAITNNAGYDQCHAARMTLKAQRLEIQRRGKLARDDATKFSKAVIAEEKRLVDIIEPEEERLQALQKAHDDAAEAEKQAKIAAEVARVESIKARVEELRGNQTLTILSGSRLISEHIVDLENIPIDSSFEEFVDQAMSAKESGVDRLRALHIAALEHEAEQARIIAERADLERLRKEQAQRDADAKAIRDAEDAERAARIAREDAEIAARRRAVQAELEQQERDAKAKRDAEEKARKDAEALTAPEPARKPVMPAQPRDAELCAAVAVYFAADFIVADYWLRNYGRAAKVA